MRTLLSLLLSTTTAFAQSFGTLTAVPDHATGLVLSWTSSPAGTNTVSRWTDANTTPVTVGTTGASTFTDTTPVANTIYYYSVGNGGFVTNTATGVVSDITMPFNCPPMVAVDPNLLGVDRTVSFSDASGNPVTYTISAPNPTVAGAHIANVNPCNGAPGCSDFTNVNAAAQGIQATGGTVFLAAGDYHFLDPNWDTGSLKRNFTFSGNDIIISGASVASGAEPTTHLYYGQTNATAGTIAGGVFGGNRVLFRNLTVDWDFPNAIPGVINNFDGSHQHFNITNGAYYVPDPAHPPVLLVGLLDAYNLTNGTYNLLAGSRVSVGASTFNASYPTGGYYYTVPGGANLPDNTPAIMIVKTGTAFSIGTDAQNFSLENVRVYGGGGPGIIQGPHAQGLRLSNVQVEKKPAALLAPGEQPRYISVFGDNDSNGALGNVLIENSQFGFIEDDTYYMRGAVFQMSSLTSTSSFVVNSAAVVVNHSSALSNNQVTFMDPATYQTIGSVSSQMSWTQVGTTWTFSLNPAIPELAPYIGLASSSLPVVGQPQWSSPNVYINNVCAHDSHGRLGFLNSNGLVENTILANSFYGPLFSSNSNTLPASSAVGNDGNGGHNFIWRNNKLIGNNYGQTDLKTLWAPTVISNGYSQTGWAAGAMSVSAIPNTGFFAPGYSNANFQIYNNFIQNTPGLCILITSANLIGVVGNTCIDANQVAYTAGFNATYCGALSQPYQAAGANQPWCFAQVAAQGAMMVTHTRNADVTSTPNVFLGTSGGLFLDTPTIRTDIIVGSRFIH